MQILYHLLRICRLVKIVVVMDLSLTATNTDQSLHDLQTCNFVFRCDLEVEGVSIEAYDGVLCVLLSGAVVFSWILLFNIPTNEILCHKSRLLQMGTRKNVP